MKKQLLLVVLMLGLTGCLGKQSVDNESIGQVKKVIHTTPLICGDFNYVDISLGVMVHGVGSMSTQDMNFVVENQQDLELLKKANESAKLVKFKYDVKRITFCQPDHVITKVEIVE